MRVAAMRTRRAAEAVLALCSYGKLFADPGDGGANGTLVGGLAFDPEVAFLAFAGVQARDDRAHEGEVADKQFALQCGADRGGAALGCAGGCLKVGRQNALPCSHARRACHMRSGMRHAVVSHSGLLHAIQTGR